MAWHAQLDLDYRRDADARCLLQHRHTGPLRVLRSLYPEGPGICHNVLVHSPGGVVAGDTLAIALRADASAHALVTTPGATRFYRSEGEAALQSLQARLARGARLEWLPLETLCHPGCIAENCLRFDLAAGAEMIGWDVLALGLPAGGGAFDRGRITQHIELPGVWLERGTIDGADARLLESKLGLAGHRAIATLWFAAGEAIAPARLQALLDAAREIIAADALAATGGCTALGERVVVLRALAPRVEPAMRLLTKVWGRWREAAWGLTACVPRVWQT